MAAKKDVQICQNCEYWVNDLSYCKAWNDSYTCKEWTKKKGEKIK